MPLIHESQGSDQPKCPGCAYSLTGLDEAPRCPECGVELASAFRDGLAGQHAMRWFKPWFAGIGAISLAWVAWRLIATHGAIRVWLALGASIVVAVLTLMIGYELGLCRSSADRRPRDWGRAEYALVLGAWSAVWLGVIVLAGFA